MKGVKAFTLIELIVVIAIIGVLAAILVPSMIGYVESSKLSTANSNAKLGLENAAVYATECDARGCPVQDDIYTADLRNVTITTYDFDGNEMEQALQVMMGTANSSGGVIEVHLDAGICSDSIWAKTPNDRCIGRWPDTQYEKAASPYPGFAGM
ncbi:MAG: prepilin-type N-terminal cleavage/methylation domain-containing protein [Oscillospiraceae bacterium]|nr:prepilin-type N-terminal cleavage/methylation domain-containing protein [Oscillospiraceae bacterium]